MTSSSDTDRVSRRRLSIRNLPSPCSTDSLKSFFRSFGAGASLSAVHLALRDADFALITFEEEEEAARAQRAAHGQTWRGKKMQVEFANPQVQVPLTGARRQIQFPRPFGARGGAQRGPNLPAGPETYQHYHRQQRCSSNTGANPSWTVTTGSSRGSRSGRARGSNYQRASGEQRLRQHLQQNHVRTVHFKPPDHHQHQHHLSPLPSHSRIVGLGLELCGRHAALFNYDNFPHIARRFFRGLDSVSLMRCKLVCKAWHRTIARHVESTQAASLGANWRSAACSFYPVTPNVAGASLTGSATPMDSSSIAETSYRNVLCLKADESEIMLAVDNGNVEVYDRHSLELKTALVGQFSASPSSLDFDARLILVSYSCGFGRPGRRSLAFWNVFDRATKTLVRSIERDSEDLIRIGFDGRLFLIGRTAVKATGVAASDSATERLLDLSTATGEGDDVDRGAEVTIDASDVDCAAGRFAAAVWREDENGEPENRLRLRIWRRAGDGDGESPPGLIEESSLAVLRSLGSLEDPSVLLSRFRCQSVQLRHPKCLVFLSNSGGYFEFARSHGRPCNVFALFDVTKDSGAAIRVITVDDRWMARHNIVPCDYDTSVVCARFSNERLAVGFGSFSDRRDGGIALWDMAEIEDVEGVPHAANLSVVSVAAPSYHWLGYDGHTGGVGCLHLDRYQMIAANSCVHQIATRCIEGGDESKKDNVIVYDFLRPGVDRRRL